MPTLNGSARTVAPCARATSAVSSVDASSTTTTSIVRVEREDLVDDAADRACLVPRGNDRDEARRSRRDPGLEPDELEQPPRPVRVRVLVEDALACPLPISSA